MRINLLLELPLEKMDKVFIKQKLENICPNCLANWLKNVV